MAIWQIPITVIPEEAILKHYDEIPSKLFVDNDGRQRALENSWIGKKDNVKGYGDAHEFNWWDGLELHKDLVFEDLNRIISNSRWDSADHASWKGKTKDNEDNDVWLSFDEETGFIGHFSFRADLRDQTSNFIPQILDVCSDNDWLIMFDDGGLIQPSLNLFLQKIPQSNASKFLLNPEAYVTSIGERIEALKAVEQVKEELNLQSEQSEEKDANKRSFFDRLFKRK